MPQERKYSSNAEKQQAYRERLKEREESTKPQIDYNKPLEPFVDYFKRVNKFENIPEFQKELCNTVADMNIGKIVISAGRGIGKTLVCGTYALWIADELSRYLRKPLHVVLISSQETIYSNIDKIFLNNPELTKRLRVTGKSMLIPQQDFEFSDTHGSVERILATPNRIRGLRANVLILDEASRISTENIKIGLPLVEEPLAKIIMISTPNKEQSYFNSLVANPQDWRLLQYSSSLADWTKTMRERIKNELSESEYRIEIDGQIPEESIKTLFTSKDIDDCVQEYVVLNGLEGNKIQIGIDYGYSRSLSVLTVVEIEGIRKRVIETRAYKNQENMYEDMAKTIKSYKIGKLPLTVLGDSKPQGCNDSLRKVLQGSGITVYDVDKSSDITQENKLITIKSLLKSQLYHLIKSRHIVISSTEKDLIDELKNYKKENGVYNIDRVDSLMLAIGELPLKPKVFGDVIFPTKRFTPRGYWSR